MEERSQRVDKPERSQHRSVDIVITNYKRPANIPIAIQAFRNNSIPVRVILVDAGLSDSAGACIYSGADEVIRLHRNYGCYNRYLAVPILKSRFVFFSDD